MPLLDYFLAVCFQNRDNSKKQPPKYTIVCSFLLHNNSLKTLFYMMIKVYYSLLVLPVTGPDCPNNVKSRCVFSSQNFQFSLVVVKDMTKTKPDQKQELFFIIFVLE